ncbi:hypothetical protein BV898_17367 [Hypsibius exemplaris]|uniref:Uncharacterized protein n=1 Tax=Hypsibius exemplaris TaxID=2072580 RepID=A0A9X6RME1_HYPEX|nr:hypothetical protein BV898_17367 [Hypsibius exemplaris]
MSANTPETVERLPVPSEATRDTAEDYCDNDPENGLIYATDAWEPAPGNYTPYRRGTMDDWSGNDEETAARHQAFMDQRRAAECGVYVVSGNDLQDKRVSVENVNLPSPHLQLESCDAVALKTMEVNTSSCSLEQK